MQTPIDWEQLARATGASTTSRGESGSDDLARRALEQILGPEEWRRAVDHYVERRPGAELTRSVLWLIRPWAAMQRCHELFQTDPDPERRGAAIELLRVVADHRALSWVRGYLADPDPAVQHWGAGIVDQLLWSELVAPEECAELLATINAHPHAAVRQTGDWIQSFLRERQAASAATNEADKP